MIYALWLDELSGVNQTRHEARGKLDEFLAEPFGEQEAQAYRRERFGQRPEDMAERQQSEAAWGDGG